MVKKLLYRKVDELKDYFRKQNKRIYLFGTSAISLIIVYLLLKDNIINVSEVLVNTIELIIFVLSALTIASVIARLLSNTSTRIYKDVERENQLLLSKLLSFTVYLLSLIIILIRLGITGSNIAIVSGFLATGFALSIRDAITSYLAWFILLTKQPFKIGDTIKFENYLGEVKHIGTFYVVLDETPNTPDHIRIPTSMFLQKPIQNFGREEFDTNIKLYIKSDFPSTKHYKNLITELNNLQASAKIKYFEDKIILEIKFLTKLDNYYDKTNEVNELLTKYSKFFSK